MKKRDIVWKDLAGEGYTLEELIDEFKLSKVVNRNLQSLLQKYKIPFTEIDKASFLAKVDHYDWHKKVSVAEPVVEEKAKPKKRAAKKTKKRKTPMGK